MDNVENKKQTENKSVYSVKRERYRVSVEIHHDLKKPLKALALQKGVTQKELIAEILYDFALKEAKEHKNITILLEQIEKLKGKNKIVLDKLQTKQKLTKNDLLQYKEYLLNYAVLAAKYSPEDFFILNSHLEKRLKFLQNNYANSEQRMLDTSW